MSTKLRIAGIVKESIVDGPGIRLVVFAQGCKHNCPGCHNPETHSFDGGKLVDIEFIMESIHKNPLLDGITSVAESLLSRRRVLQSLPVIQGRWGCMS